MNANRRGARPAWSSPELFSYQKRESDFEIVPGKRILDRHEVALPYRNRSNENAKRLAQKLICTDEIFLAQLDYLRLCVAQVQNEDHLPFEAWLEWLSNERNEIFLRLRDHAKAIGRHWRLDSWQWIVWLAKEWAPTRDKTPPLEPGAALAVIAPWIVDAHSHRLNSDPGEWQTKYVQITLRPGISRRQAEEALKAAFEKLPLPKPQGRPSVSERERTVLRQLFEKLNLPKTPAHGAPKEGIRRVLKALEVLYTGDGKPNLPGSLQDIDNSTVIKEYYKWAAVAGINIRKRPPYTTSKRDRRSV